MLFAVELRDFLKIYSFIGITVPTIAHRIHRTFLSRTKASACFLNSTATVFLLHDLLLSTPTPSQFCISDVW